MKFYQCNKCARINLMGSCCSFAEFKVIRTGYDRLDEIPSVYENIFGYTSDTTGKINRGLNAKALKGLNNA